MRLNRRNRGFTLLEVMIAVVIFAVAILSLTASVSSGIAQAGEASNLRAAREICRGRLAAVVAGTETGSGGPIEGHEGFTWSLTREEKTTGAADPPTEKYDVLTVTVTFPSEVATPAAGAEKGTASVSLTTMVDPPDLADSSKDTKKP